MWSEEMDKKIRAAAENDMHGYDDKSWNDMEMLLDKHLPQKKSRRRIIFFLLAALMVVSIPTYLILKYYSPDNNTLTSNNNPVVEQKTGDKTTSQNETATDRQTPASNKSTTHPTSEQVATNTTTAVPSTTITNDQTTSEDGSSNRTVNTLNNDQLSKKPVATVKTLLTGTEKKGTSKVTVRNGGTARRTNIVANPTKPVTANNPPVTKPTTEPGQTANTIDNNPVATTSGSEKSSTGTAPEVKPVATDATADASKAPVKTQSVDSAVATTESPVKKEKKKSSPSSKFFISLSAGPDYSNVASRSGSWRGVYGLGMGYSFSDRWSVRTGFYVARKVYTADSNNYKYAVMPGPYQLDYIDANCLVYEVPVNVVYNVANGKKHSWFVSGGLSSYFMRSEKYDYYYKYLSMTQKYTHKYKNENNHLFSVLGLSAGYQYKFNNRLSLLAEPYVRLPLSGIGYGSVKLKSAGALFTVTYKPFGPK